MAVERDVCVRRAGVLLSGALLLAVGSGCDGGSGGSTKYELVAVSDGDDDHEDVVLKDRYGFPIAPDSDEPYSPRETCGECHWVDFIANGYHFQQGRTDANGAIVVKDDYFGRGTDYVRSSGMYGKW